MIGADFSHNSGSSSSNSGGNHPSPPPALALLGVTGGASSTTTNTTAVGDNSDRLFSSYGLYSGVLISLLAGVCLTAQWNDGDLIGLRFLLGDGRRSLRAKYVRWRRTRSPLNKCINSAFAPKKLFENADSEYDWWLPQPITWKQKFYFKAVDVLFLAIFCLEQVQLWLTSPSEEAQFADDSTSSDFCDDEDDDVSCASSDQLGPSSSTPSTTASPALICRKQISKAPATTTTVRSCPRVVDKSGSCGSVFGSVLFFLEKLRLGFEMKYVQTLVQSKRHFFMFMSKRSMGLGVVAGEKEFRTFLDIRNKVTDYWAFMWEVENVNKEEILCQGHPCIPMSSYSYLNFIRDTRVNEFAIECARKYAPGNHGPRMLGGNTGILCQLEKQIAQFFGREACQTTSAGYLSTMSAVAALTSDSDVIFSDSRIHASLRTGVTISPASLKMDFYHNNFKHLEQLAAKHRKKYKTAWIVIESVYSMDGDIANLPAALAVAKKYDMKILLDEAHGLGVLGKTGRGLEEHFGLPGSCDVICGTFSKSIGSVGGYITSSTDMVQLLEFYSQGNVFSAPLSAYHAGAALKAFQLIDEEPWRVTKAQAEAKYLRDVLRTGLGLWPRDYPEESKFFVEGDDASTVIPVIFWDDIDRVMRIACRLMKEGFMVSAVAYPACKLRQPRFRITATAASTKENSDRFVRTLVRLTLEEQPATQEEAMVSLMGGKMKIENVVRPRAELPGETSCALAGNKPAGVEA